MDETAGAQVRTLVQGHTLADSGAVARAGEKTHAKIEKRFAKLARKLGKRAGRAKAKADGAKDATKRAVLLRRFELYADAAHHLEARLVSREDRDD